MRVHISGNVNVDTVLPLIKLTTELDRGRSFQTDFITFMKCANSLAPSETTRNSGSIYTFCLYVYNLCHSLIYGQIKVDPCRKQMRLKQDMFVKHYAPYVTFDFKNGNSMSHCQILLLLRSRSRSQAKYDSMVGKVVPKGRNMQSLEALGQKMQRVNLFRFFWLS